MLSLPLTESESLELKREWSGRMKGLEDLAAFANTHGGTLIIGVEDDGVSVPGFEPDDPTLRSILNEIVDSLRITPEVRREPTENGPQVITIQVRPSTLPVAYRGRYLKRVGSTNRDMTFEEISRRAVEISGQTWDALPAAHPFGLDGNASHLSPQALGEFLNLARTNLPFADPSDSQRRTLENLGLVRDGRPTRAAMLLFGRRPQDTASGTGVQIAQFKDGRLLQERVIDGPLLNQVGETLEALRVFLGVGYDIGDRALLEGRGDLSLLERVQRAENWPFPLAALREAVVNALIHREYTSADRTQIQVEGDRLSLWNPGGLMEGLSLEELQQPRHPSRRRNPLLADAFHTAGLVERWGTGTTRMINTMNDAGLPAPTFGEDGGGFRVTFQKTPFPAERLAILNQRQQQALQYLIQHRSITNSQYRDLTDATERTASLDLKKMADLGFITRQGKGRDVSYRLNPTGNPQ